MGIVPYFGSPFTGLDVEFNPPFHPLLKRVVGSVIKIPFKKDSFDIVICVDTLEHLEHKLHQKALYEMMRVAKKKLLIAVPCGKKAYHQDVSLNRLYAEKYGMEYHFLKEQINLGLPEEKNLKNTIEKAAAKSGKKIQLRIINNENLTLRSFLMKGWLSKNLIVNIIHRKIFLVLIPILSMLNNDPVYRKIFIVDINENSN